VGDDPFELLPLETHLEELQVPFSQTLLNVLPRCSSIRKLQLASLLSTHKVESLSKVLLQAPFIRNLSFRVSSPDENLESLPLSTLASFKLTSSSSEAISAALTNSQPKSSHSLTDLHLYGLTSTSYGILADALLECPSLTHLNISPRQTEVLDILPVVRVLPRLPLTNLTLDLIGYTDASIECLLSLMPQSALQHLSLGTLSPKQEHLLAGALPSMSSLKSLEFNTRGYNLCQHDSSHVALFSALTSSPLRSLTLSSCSLRHATYDACFNKLPNSQLARLYLSVRVYASGFDPTIHGQDYQRADLNLKLSNDNWETRFPHCHWQLKDRYCLIAIETSTLLLSW
jgi:hypothetical protein